MFNPSKPRSTATERSKPPAQQDGAAFNRLVTSCETVLATELAGWVEQMNDTLR